VTGLLLVIINCHILAKVALLILMITTIVADVLGLEKELEVSICALRQHPVAAPLVVTGRLVSCLLCWLVAVSVAICCAWVNARTAANARKLINLRIGAWVKPFLIFRLASAEAWTMGTARAHFQAALAVDNSKVHGYADAHSLARYPLARCLDGSPARYYLSKGDASRIFVFFEGGGFCDDLASCQARAGTRLGSTVHDPLVMKLDRPYFSRSPVDSPLLSSFTFAYVRYCDGGYYSGERASEVMYNNTPLHFKGRWITEALFRDLRLDAASHVVMGGCSAGGIRVLAHLDYLRSLLPATVSVAGFADSGFYTDVPSFTNLKRFVVAPDGQNATRLLSQHCLAAHPLAAEKCLIAQHAARYLRTGTFVWQSLFDADQRSCEMNPSCAAAPACVELYAQRLSHAIHQGLLAADMHLPSPHVRHGAFIDMCDRHCDDGIALPFNLTVDGANPLQAFARWYGAKEDNQSRTVWEVEGNLTMKSC